MRIDIEEKEGLVANYNNQTFCLRYPKKIWQIYPDSIKRAFVDNMTFLLTINTPIISKKKELTLSTHKPKYLTAIRDIILKSVPGALEEYKQSIEKEKKRIENIKYNFDQTRIREPHYKNKLGERAIIPLSLGKDSLTTLGLTKEIGLNPVCTYINDTVSPSENTTKKNFFRKVIQEQQLKGHIIKNEFEKLNDFEFWEKGETCLGYSHMLTSFCMGVLPLTHYYKAKYIVPGNEKNLDFPFIGREGCVAYPSYDQTTECMKEQSEMVKGMTNNQGEVFSVISPITNIVITHLLVHHYPSLAKYWISCDSLDASTEPRWCHNCATCATISMFMLAVNADIDKMGLRHDFLKKKHKKYYAIFNGKLAGSYDRSRKNRDEQLFAFYLAYRNGIKGNLMDLFKKELLDEAINREKELKKSLLHIYPSSLIPKQYLKKLKPIYKESIRELQ